MIHKNTKSEVDELRRIHEKLEAYALELGLYRLEFVEDRSPAGETIFFKPILPEEE